jgi:hypothetical protein
MRTNEITFLRKFSDGGYAAVISDGNEIKYWDEEIGWLNGHKKTY